MLTEEQKKKASSYRNSQNQTGLTDDQKKKADSYRTSLQSPEDWQQRTSSLASAVLTLDHAVAGNQWRSGTQLSGVKSQIDSLERAKNLFFSLYGGNAGADQRVAELDEKLAGYRDWLAQKEKEYAAELDGSAARERQAAAIADYTGGETKNPYAIGTSVAAMMHQQALPDSEDELQDLLADEQEAQRKAGSKSHRVATALYNWLSGDSIAETREADQVTQNAHENRVRRVSDALAAAKLQRYADYRNEKDFTENSQYRSTAEDGEFVTTADGKTYLVQDGQYHRYSGTGFGDIEYDFINKNERATDLVTNGGWASDYEKTAEFMTDDEIAMFNYLYARQGAESAYAYMDSLQTTLNARYREKAEEAAREFAQESPALASVYSVASAPVKGLAYIGQTIDYLDDGVIDQNAPYNRVSYGTNAMISQVAEDISGSMGDIALTIGDFVTSGATRLLPEQWREKVRQTLNGSKFWGSAGSFLYQTGMSMGEFLLTSAVTMGNEPLALGILGTGAAADAVIAAKDRGLNDGQAFTLGTIAGAAEIITEKISIETLLNPDLLADGTLKYILENALAEGGEEVGSDVINLIADLIISGDKSEWAVSMQEYMAAGKTEAAAFGLTLANQGEEMILDFLGGALSGGVMGSGMAVANNIYTGRLVDDLNLGSMTDEDIRAMVETGLESGEDTSSYKLAKKIQEKLDSGENPTATELARLFQANAQAIEQEQQESEPEQKQSKARALFDRAVEQAKERNMFHRAAQTVTGATDTKKTSSTSQTTSKSSGQSTTETAKPEAASAPTVSSESEYVRTAMASGAVSREDAAKIVQMPGYAAAFEKETGIKLTGTEEQKINAVIQGGAAWAENQRLRGIAQASQNAVPGESTATKAQRTTAWDSFYTYGKVAAEATKPIDFEQARSSLVAFAQLLGDKTAREAFEKGRTDAKSAQKARQTQTAKKKSSGKFTDKRTQTPKGGEYKALTDTLRAFSKKTGIDVELVDSLSSGSTKANGRLLVDTMTIQLSADSNNILSALGHETAEYLKAYSPEAYTQVRDQILNWWMSHESASSIDEVVERYREAYIRAGQKSKSYSSALDEVLNDALGAMLTTDEGLESFVKWVNTASNLTQTQRKNLFKQIGDIIRKMIDGLKELLKNSRLTSDQKRFLEMEAQEQQKILDRFLDAVERTQVDASGGENTGKAEHSFAGARSVTADKQALEEAKRMEQRVMSSDERKKTPPNLGDENTVFAERDTVTENEKTDRMEYSLAGYDQHQIDNWAGSKNIVVYQGRQQLHQFLTDAVNGQNLSKKIYFGAIPSDLAQRILKDTGINVDGYNCTLRASEVRKILKDHGNTATENKRGQRAITISDFERIPDVIQSPDRIELSQNLFEGKPVILFSKVIDGKTTVVAYVSEKHKDLTVQTMYSGKNKNGSLATTPGGANSLPQTSKTLSGTASNGNVTQSSERVKSEYSIEVPTEELNPLEIVPVNEVTDRRKYRYLTEQFAENGWDGRPVVVIDTGNGYTALTGSHRVAAARAAMIDVPAVVLEYSDELSDLVNAIDDEDRTREAKLLYEAGIIHKDVYDLIAREDELNVSNYGVAYGDQAKWSIEVPESEVSQEQRDEWESVFNASGASREAYDEMQGEVEKAEQAAAEAVRAARKSGVLGRKVSMEDPQKTVAKLQEENRKLRERLDYWREQIRKTKKGEFRVDKFFVKRVAEKLIENYGLRTWTDAQDLAGELTDLYTRIAKGDPYESYAGDAEQLARKIAQHATDDYMYREYEEFRNTLRETTLSLSKSEAGQIADFNDLRKRYFGRVKIRTGETNVDQIFQNLAVEMPTGLLSEEAYNNPVDQFLRLLEVVDTLYEPGGKLYNRESMDTAVEIIRDEILHGFVTTEAGPTFADRQAEARKTAVQKAEDQVNRKRDKELGDTVAALSKQAQQFADEAAERGRLEGMLAGQMMQGRQMAAAVRQANARSATLEERLDSASRTIRELRKQLDEEKRGAWEDARESVRLSHALERSEAAVKKARDRLKEYRENRNERDAVARERLQVEKLAKSLAKMLTTNTSKSYVPEDLKTAVGDLLQSIDFSSKSLREKGQQTRRDRDYAAMMTKVRQALEAHTRFDDGGDMFVDLPSEFLGLLQEHIDNVVESAGRASAIGTNIVFEMSSGQLSDLRHILTVVHSALKNINSFYVAARGQTVRQAADSTIRYAREHGDAKGNPDSWIRRQLEWDNTVPVYAFLRFGDGGKQVFGGMQDGWDKFAFNLKAVFDFKAATFTDKEAQEWAEQVHEVTLGEETVKLSSAQIMSLVSLAKREHGQKHLLQGGIRIDDIARKVKGKNSTIRQSRNYNLTMEDVAAMEGMLTARQRDVAAKMQKFMQEQGSAWGNEVTMKRFGYRGFTEENYFPIMSDPNNMAAMDPNAKANDMMRLINMSATKPVNEKANNAVVISNIFDVFANHMADMAKYNALALPILDMMKWYNYVEKVDGADGQFTTRSVQQSLEAAYGKAAGNYIRTFIKDLNGVKEFGRGEDWSAKLMSNYKVAAVGANLRVAALQPTAYVRAWAVLDLPSMGRALSMNPKKGASEMERYSGMGLWKSMGFYDTNVNRGLRDQLSGRGTKVDNLRDKSMAAAELMDKLTWGVIWNACKLEIMDSSKLTGEALMEATAKKFREVVYKTQVVDSTMTRSQNMRSTGALAKITTAFMSEPTLSYNLVMEGVRGYQEAKRTGSGMDKAKKLMVRSFLAYGASALVSAIVESFVDALRDDDDYETFLQKFNQAFWGENGKFWEGNLVQDLMIHNKLPLVKDIIAIFGGDSADRMDLAAFTDLKAAWDIWAETIRLATGKLESPTKATYYGNMTLYGKIYKSLKAVSELMGLPVSSATRDVVTLWNNTVGGLYKDLKIKTYDPGDEQSILHALKDGRITADAAQALLVEKVEGISADDAYWAAKKAATGYSKTGELSEALESGDAEHIQTCIDEMLAHGYEQKDISGAVSPVIKKLYTEDEDGNLGAGRISREQAEKLLASWITKDESEIFWTLRKWDQSVEAGETVGQYDDLYNAIASGDGVQNAVQFYMDNGVEKKTMSGNVTRAFEEEYIDLYYSDPMAADALKQRLIAAYKAMGYTTDEAREKISGWLEGDDEE